MDKVDGVVEELNEIRSELSSRIARIEELVESLKGSEISDDQEDKVRDIIWDIAYEHGRIVEDCDPVAGELSWWVSSNC